MTFPTCTPLVDVCKIVQGGRHKLSGNDFVSQGFPAYGAGGLNGFLPSFEFERNAIVLSSIGARCGKCFYVEGRWSSLANTQIILPDPKRADARFLWFQLNDEARWPRSGTAQPFIKPSDVKLHRVYLPPIAEQRRIVTILNQADALRAKRRAALAQLDEMAQAIFLGMFGDVKKNERGWTTRPLVDFCFPKQWPTITSQQLLSSGYPVYGANGQIGFYSDFNHKTPTVLVTCRGATCGTVNISPPNCYVTGNAMALDELDTDLLEIRYLATALRWRGLSDVISGSAQPQITRQSLAPVKLAVPPLNLQHLYRGKVEAIDSLRLSYTTAIIETSALFSSLQHRAFTGAL